ncbi:MULTISPECIES: 4'-phosphopantetheinyl transferase family protein [Mesorhizobium]|uniref:4'-phosphopantetheinyl transferase family protein n=1 Tax=Mesorhizobium TaxID=68287 RepID=UPI0010A96396|nr:MULTISPECIES: 4'-phosphopantetheinyl transferase superfamily protein [Mesorhizobium]
MGGSWAGKGMVLPVEPELRDDRSSVHLVAAVRQLVSHGLVVEGGDLTPADRDLRLEEELSLGNVVPARRREFRAGRFYARQALHGLGAGGSVPIGDNRAPLWPTGIVGSISHTRSLCVVAVGSSTEFLGVGIDIEEDSPLSCELAQLVSDAAELEGREGIERRLGCDLPKLLFVIKEAFYKMYFPLTGRFLAFHDVSVELDVEKHAAKAQIVPSKRLAAIDSHCFEGRFGSSCGTLFSCFELSAR